MGEKLINVESVLIVDDHPLVLQGLRRALEKWVPDIRIAATHDEALALMGAKPPDLALVDLHLPVPAAGLAVARMALSLCPAPLVIMMSGRADDYHIAEIGELTVVPYIRKTDISPELLRRFVQKLRLRYATLAEEAGRLLVGRMSLPEAQARLRAGSIARALNTTRGNISESAKLLGLSRGAVQHALRKEDRADPLSHDSVSIRPNRGTAQD